MGRDQHGGEQHAAWQSRLPENETALWDRLLAQDTATVTGLLAYCVACYARANFSGRGP